MTPDAAERRARALLDGHSLARDAAPDLARDVLALADALRTERAAREAAEASAALSARAAVDAARELGHVAAAAVAERDTARSALDGLVAAVRAERETRYRVPAHYDADYAGSEERARVGALIDAHDATVERLDALLSAAPPRSTVDARVVREYLAAVAVEVDVANAPHSESWAGTYVTAKAATDTARTALDAALAAAEGTR